MRIEADGNAGWPSATRATMYSVAEGGRLGAARHVLTFLLNLQEEQRSAGEGADDWSRFAAALTDDAVTRVRTSLTGAMRQVHPEVRLAEAADILLLGNESTKAHCTFARLPLPPG